MRATHPNLGDLVILLSVVQGASTCYGRCLHGNCDLGFDRDNDGGIGARLCGFGRLCRCPVRLRGHAK